MTTPQSAPYGSWRSPITPDLIVSDFINIGSIALDGADIYWTELRPSEKGRSVIVRRTPDGKTSEVAPSTFNARTRVHEYGGGEFTVNEGVVYSSSFADNRLYRIIPDSEPTPITPAAAYRYADAIVDRSRKHLIVVREDHTPTDREAINTLVTLSTEGDNPDGGVVLVSGNDFYSSPRLSPDGTKLTWLTWHHPNMPWDGCELWVGELNADGSLGKSEQVAGGPSESIFQPEWSPNGILYFISDRSNWWNIYRLHNGQSEAVSPKDTDFAGPQWVFGMSSYGFVSEQQIVCTYGEDGATKVARLNTETGELIPFVLPYTTIGRSSIHINAQHAVFVGGSPTKPSELVELAVQSGQLQVLRISGKISIDQAYFSVPETIEFPTENGKTAYAYYYAPRNPDYVAPHAELPPLLVHSHGGPTASTSSSFNLGTQFWTSRGFAVLDVNYGGSSGYGREYRERLNGQWGVVDVDDCVNGAKYLVQRGLVDGNRLAIAGGSAGGYTTLCALTFRDTFKAGASHFGVSDLTVFVSDTHKFESRYLYSLVGPYPEAKELYHQRSALFYADQLSDPVIFFQGLDDKIVPPNQAEGMVEVLRKKGIPVAYLAFEGEGHGFRRSENIKRTLEAELYFYSKVFGFQLADAIEPVEIANLS